jgi:hypothetical protein
MPLHKELNNEVLLNEEAALKKSIADLKKQLSAYEEIADLEGLRKQVQDKVDSVKKDEQKADEVIKGLTRILREGNNPYVRTVISKLVTIQVKLNDTWNWIIPILMSFLITTGTFAFLYIRKYIVPDSGPGIFILGIICFILLCYPVDYFWTLRLKKQEQKLEEEIGRYRNTEELKDKADPDEFFRQLVQINFTHIDGYYRQTQIQANKSFWISLICALSAFGIIIYGIYVINTTNQQFGYITTISGILSEFIAAVFFYLYNQTIRSMGLYHQKLVLTQNVGLAIKVAQDLEGADKSRAKDFIIQQLLKDINQQLVFSKKG